MKRAYDPAVEGQYRILVAGHPIRRRWHWNKLRLYELVGVSTDDRVLDAGCGAGTLVFELAPLCRQAVGCDLRYTWLDFATRRGRGAYVQTDLQQLPFADAAFKTIFFLEVLEHLERARTPQVLHEFCRVLQPQGQLLVTTPNYRSLWVIIEFLADTLHTLGLVPDRVGGGHIAKYHQRTLADALTTAGFGIRRIGTFNHLSPFLALLSERWAERFYRWELKKSRSGGNLLYALCEKL